MSVLLAAVCKTLFEELFMSDEVKAQGPIQVIGGIGAVIALVKKYYAPAMATIALVVWLVSYLTGKTDAPPPPPPIWPEGLYVSDGVHPLKVAPPEVAIAASKAK